MYIPDMVYFIGIPLLVGGCILSLVVCTKFSEMRGRSYYKNPPIHQSKEINV